MRMFILLALLAASWTGIAFAQNKAAAGLVVEVYYFHGTHRCPTCISIEENAKKTLDTYFKDQKAKGTVKMIVVDIDDPVNKALVEKYEVSGSSLILNKTRGGKSITTDLTNFAFSYSRNDTPKFVQGLKDKISEMLNK